MASAGTLISDLDGGGSEASDNDIVAQIMADMNGGGSTGGAPALIQPPQMQQHQQQQQMHALPPAPSGRATGMIPSPNPNTIIQNTIDPTVATAHIIGNRQPTPADFAAMMNMGTPYSHMMSGSPGANIPFNYMPQNDNKNTNGSLVDTIFPTGNFLRELKTPVLVAIIFCVMSLPVINVMIGHYFPRLLRIGGDLTMIGLGVKSLMAGAVFFIIQRVLVPLVTN
jgi:hypothetical protein